MNSGLLRTLSGWLPMLAMVLAPGPAGGEPLITDRPGNGNSATTVGQLRLQVETSVNFVISPDALSLPTGLRFGLTDFWELRVLSGLFGVNDGDVQATDTAVGTKLSLLANQGAVPALALMVDVFLPSGGAAFTRDEVVPEFRMAASWGLPFGLALLANVGADIPEDADGRFAQLLYVANASYSIPVSNRQASIFVESFGLLAFEGASRPDIVQLDAGAAYLVTEDFQLDVFVQIGLTEAAPDFQIAGGVSFRL
ncbi:MAG: transporter [Myxococcota bacterium]